MEKQNVKRGRPAKESVVATEQPKKNIFKPIEQSAPLMKEYELLGENGMIFMMKAGPVSIYDQTTDSVKSIRYIPSENSVFVEDQTSKPYKKPIIFERSKLWVKRNEPNLAKFLDLHPGNEANGGTMFRLVDLSKNAKKDIDKEFLVVDALTLLREKPVSDLLAVATAFGLNVDRPFDEIKHDLLLSAKTTPEQFIGAFDNPVIDAKAKIKKAMSAGIIKYSDGHIRWTDTNTHIIAVPAGQEPTDVFTRYCMTEAGAPVLSEIERQL